MEYAGIQCPEDKPYIESFFGSYKTEELYRNEYSSMAEARTGWGSYCAWYRNDRLHQTLWYKSPRDYAKIARESNLLVA
ncbi:integrase core domain-containing protein [Chloroflexota bacterium]